MNTLIFTIEIICIAIVAWFVFKFMDWIDRILLK